MLFFFKKKVSNLFINYLFIYILTNYRLLTQNNGRLANVISDIEELQVLINYF